MEILRSHSISGISELFQWLIEYQRHKKLHCATLPLRTESVLSIEPENKWVVIIVREVVAGYRPYNIQTCLSPGLS